MRRTICIFWLLAAILHPQLATAAETTAPAVLPKCLFVSSYHRGHAWSDNVAGQEALATTRKLGVTGLQISKRPLRRAKKIEIRQSKAR